MLRWTVPLLVLLAASCAATPPAPAGPPPCGRIEVYVRRGCPHCAHAKDYLDTLKLRRPGLEVVYYDLADEPRYREELADLYLRLGLGQPGVPTMLVCGRVFAGFSEARTPGEVEPLVGGVQAMPEIVQ